MISLLPDTKKPMSLVIIDTVIKKYHYYIIGFDHPEDFAMLWSVLWLGVTSMPALMKTGPAFFCS